MIVRVVKMEFQEEKVAEFLALFEERKERIRHFQGCRHLELWRQAGTTNVYFTYSHWNAETDLNHYRFSEFFKDTWARTKALFIAKPQAWSVNQKMILK